MGVHSKWETTKRLVNEIFHRKRFHFASTFSGESGEYVLKELSKFVHLNDNLYRDDQRKQDVLLGQRSVILFILQYVRMSDEEIFNLTKPTEPVNVTRPELEHEHPGSNFDTARNDAFGTHKFPAGTGLPDTSGGPPS